MPTTKPRRTAARQVPRILADYRPLRVLWSGSNPPYGSEQQARWALRQHRSELASAAALALHQGRMFVHPEIFVRVVERCAIEAAQRRAAPSSRGSSEG
jgi:hypothetical protein